MAKKAVSVAQLAASRLAQIQKDRAPPRDLSDPKFPEQTAFIQHPARRKVVFCSRRAGKSWSFGLYLHQTALRVPGCSVLYIALTRDSAKRIMWASVLKPQIRIHNLVAKTNETELSITYSNGSVCYLLGADASDEERRKILGQKFALVVIDEAPEFTTNLADLIYGTISPAVTDYNGTICLAGTPALARSGIFYDMTKEQDPSAGFGSWNYVDREFAAEWVGFKWNTYNNPYLREQWAKEIEEKKRINPRIEDTPLFQRHYLGRWTVDESNLVYRYRPGFNDFDGTLPTYPTGQWRYVLGVDLGYNDPTAFTVLAYHDTDRRCFVLESRKYEKLDITATVEEVRRIEKRYEFSTYVVDGANKQAVEEMKKRHAIPWKAADKRGKADFIEILNGDLIQGHLVLNPGTCEELVDEMQGLVWKEASTRREEDPRCPNHNCDSALYGWRYIYSYHAEKAQAAPPVPGTRAFSVAEAERMKEATRRVVLEERGQREAIEDFLGVVSW